MGIPRTKFMLYMLFTFVVTTSLFGCRASANIVTDAFRKTAVCFVVDVTTITSDTDDEFITMKDYIRQRVLPGWDVCLVVAGPDSCEVCRVSGRDKKALLSRFDEMSNMRTQQQKLARSGRKRSQGSYIVEALKAATDYLNSYPDRKRKLMVVSDMVAQTPQKVDVDRLVSNRPRFTGDGPVDLRIFGVRSDVYQKLASAWVPRFEKAGINCDLQPASRQMCIRDTK